MIMATLFSRWLIIVAFFIWSVVTSTHVSSATLVLEDGYTVTTVLNGHKHGINPRSIQPRPGSPDLLVLDSSGSAFYDVSFPTPQVESVIRHLSGDGDGFEDGDLDTARFASPQSFAVDLSGNVYVADKKNHAIRKISKSGVSTIAGGLSNRTGFVDGPAENASFSSDFELVFIPERCVMLISDHGNQLVRQINLKSDDCARGSQSVMVATSLWILGLGVSCLLGIVIGFALHPYIVARTGWFQSHLSQREVEEGVPNHSGDAKSHVFDNDLMCFDEDPGPLNPVKESVPLVNTEEFDMF